MKAAQQQKFGELRMSSAEFDRMMRGALQAQPEEVPKKKRTTKAKTARKKSNVK